MNRKTVEFFGCFVVVVVSFSAFLGFVFFFHQGSVLWSVNILPDLRLESGLALSLMIFIKRGESRLCQQILPGRQFRFLDLLTYV